MLDSTQIKDWLENAIDSDLCPLKPGDRARVIKHVSRVGQTGTYWTPGGHIDQWRRIQGGLLPEDGLGADGGWLSLCISEYSSGYLSQNF